MALQYPKADQFLSQASAMPMAQSVSSCPDLTLQNDSRPNILIVDDDINSQLLLLRLFKKNYPIRRVSSGEEALSICRSDTPPDLVLLDIMMPGMDGLQVARRMREYPSSANIPIIFVTAKSDNQTLSQCLSLGAVDFVSKPIDGEIIRLRVRNFMNYVAMYKKLKTTIRLSEMQITISQRIGCTGSCVYDINTDIVSASIQMLNIFGLPTNISDYPLDNFLACVPQHRDLIRQTLAGKFGFPADIADYPLDDFLDGIPEHDPIRQVLVDLISQSHSYSGEFTIQPVGGLPTKVIHAISKIEWDDHGTPIKIFGFVQDITERKSVEVKLAKLLADKNAILESEVVGFFIMSQRVIRWANHAAAKMLGYETHEMCDLSTRIFYQNDDTFEAFGRDAYGEINAGLVFHRQIQWCHKNGSLKWFDISGSRLPSDHEVMIWAFVDISTLKLTEADLIQAKVTADAANISKSRFLATMSHELRTPMNGILGMAQLLMQNSIENERHEYVKIILSSGQALLALLNDILDLAKIESGKFEMESVNFRPNSILRDTHMLFSGMALAKGLHLEYQWKGLPDSRYLSDATRIRQMLSNLVCNAIKFTKKGFVRMEGVEIERDGESALLEFSVSDTGIGIPPDKINLLFKPFSQTDNSITRQFGGTGLGLSIVSELAKMMGGNVGIESVAGNGSRFWFSLRVQQVANDDNHSNSECLVSAKAIRIPDLLAGRVLVVEDNATNRIVIESLLTRLGVSVMSARDGQHALNVITQGDCPDLVLMDLHMPVMDGYEATTLIRQWEINNNRPRVPIIALTAYAYLEDRQNCLAVGMDDVLTKPIAFDVLKVTLYKWLPMSNTVEVRQVVNTSPSDRVIKPLDRHLFVALVEEIKPLLAQNMFSAVTRFKALQILVKGTDIEAEMHEIGLLLNSLKLNETLNRLSCLAANYTEHTL